MRVETRSLPLPVLTSLLLHRHLSSRLIAAVTAPDAIERAVWLDFISDKSATIAADADRDMVAALNADAFRVVGPDELVKIAVRFDRNFRLVVFSGGILTGRVVVAFQATATGARCALVAASLTPQ